MVRMIKGHMIKNNKNIKQIINTFYIFSMTTGMTNPY